MAERFRERLIELGGLPIGEDYVLSPVRDWTYMLFRNDGGEVVKITTTTRAKAFSFAKRYLRDNPEPRVTFLGPPI